MYDLQNDPVDPGKLNDEQRAGLCALMGLFWYPGDVVPAEEILLASQAQGLDLVAAAAGAACCEVIGWTEPVGANKQAARVTNQGFYVAARWAKVMHDVMYRNLFVVEAQAIEDRWRMRIDPTCYKLIGVPPSSRGRIVQAVLRSSLPNDGGFVSTGLLVRRFQWQCCNRNVRFAGGAFAGLRWWILDRAYYLARVILRDDS